MNPSDFSHKRNFIFFAVVWQQLLIWVVTGMLVKAEEGDITSARLSCNPGTTLRIDNLMALGLDMLPQLTDSGDPVRCDQLLATESAVRNQCDKQQECTVDLAALQLTKAICPNTSYVSINCVCVAPDGTTSLVAESTSNIEVAKSADDKRAAQRDAPNVSPTGPPTGPPVAPPVAPPPAPPPAAGSNETQKNTTNDVIGALRIIHDAISGGAENNNNLQTTVMTDFLNSLHGIQTALGALAMPKKAPFPQLKVDVAEHGGKDMVGEIRRVLTDMEQYFSSGGNVQATEGSNDGEKSSEQMQLSLDVAGQKSSNTPNILNDLQLSFKGSDAKSKDGEILKALSNLKDSLHGGPNGAYSPSNTDVQVSKLVDSIEDYLGLRPDGKSDDGFSDSANRFQDEITTLLNGIKQTLYVLSRKTDTDTLDSLARAQTSLNHLDRPILHPYDDLGDLADTDLMPIRPVPVMPVMPQIQRTGILQTLSVLGKSLLRANQFLKKMYHSLHHRKKHRRPPDDDEDDEDKDLEDSFSDVTVLERENVGNIINAMRDGRDPDLSALHQEKPKPKEDLDVRSEFVQREFPDGGYASQKGEDAESEDVLNEIAQLLENRLRKYEAQKRRYKNQQRMKEARARQRENLRNRMWVSRWYDDRSGYRNERAGPVKTSRAMAGPVKTSRAMAGPVKTSRAMTGPIKTSRAMAGPVKTSKADESRRVPPPRLLKVSKAAYIKQLKDAEVAAKEEDLIDARVRKVEAEQRRQSEIERRRRLQAEQRRKLQAQRRRHFQIEQRRRQQAQQLRRLDAQLMRMLRAQRWEESGVEQRERLHAHRRMKSEAGRWWDEDAELSKREAVRREIAKAIRKRNFLSDFRRIVRAHKRRQLNRKRRGMKNSHQSEKDVFDVQFHKVSDRVNDKRRQAFPNRLLRNAFEQNSGSNQVRNESDKQPMSPLDNFKLFAQEVIDNRLLGSRDDRIRRRQISGFQPEQSKSRNMSPLDNFKLFAQEVIDNRLLGSRNDRVKRRQISGFQPEQSKSRNMYWYQNRKNNASSGDVFLLREIKPGVVENHMRGGHQDWNSNRRDTNRLQEGKKVFKQKLRRADSAENLKYGQQHLRVNQLKELKPPPPTYRNWSSTGKDQLHKNKGLKRTELVKAYSEKQHIQDQSYGQEKQKRSKDSDSKQNMDFEQMMKTISSPGLFDRVINENKPKERKPEKQKPEKQKLKKQKPEEQKPNKPNWTNDDRSAKRKFKKRKVLHEVKSFVRETDINEKKRLYHRANDILRHLNNFFAQTSLKHRHKLAKERQQYDYGQNIYGRQMGQNSNYDWNRRRVTDDWNGRWKRQNKDIKRRISKLRVKQRQAMGHRDRNLESKNRRKSNKQLKSEPLGQKHWSNKQMRKKAKQRMDRHLMSQWNRNDQSSNREQISLRKRSFYENLKNIRMRNQQLENRETRRDRGGTVDNYRTTGKGAERQERQTTSEDERWKAAKWKEKLKRWIQMKRIRGILKTKRNLSERAHQADRKHRAVLQRQRLDRFEAADTSFDNELQKGQQNRNELGNASIGGSYHVQPKQPLRVTHVGKRVGTVKPDKLRKHHKTFLKNVGDQRASDQLDIRESRTNRRDYGSMFDQIEVYRLVQKRNQDRASAPDNLDEVYPRIDSYTYVCSGSNCATVTKTLGLPVREFNQAEDVLVVAKNGLLATPPGSRKRWKLREYPCKRIKQRTQGYMHDLENWQICHLKGHVPPDVMAMIRNNYFVVVTRTKEGSGRRMILVQKDDNRITNEIIQRILHGFERGKGSKSIGSSDDDFTLIGEAFGDSEKSGESKSNKTVEVEGSGAAPPPSSPDKGGAGPPSHPVDLGNGTGSPSQPGGGGSEAGPPSHPGAIASEISPPGSPEGGKTEVGPPSSPGGGGNGAAPTSSPDKPVIGGESSTSTSKPGEGGTETGSQSLPGGEQSGAGSADDLKKMAAGDVSGTDAGIEKTVESGRGADNASTACSPTDRPCRNNGVCRLNPATKAPTCVCSFGFFGDQCEVKVLKCPLDQSPCQNGGTCAKANGMTYCMCPLQFTGPSCEIKQVIPCSTNPCHSGGTCKDTPGGFVCACPPDRKGERCQVSAHACAPDHSPCGEGGVCVPVEGEEFLCLCDALHYGPTCNSSFEPCKGGDQCRNGGTCLIPTETTNTTAGLPFHCVCSPGFRGGSCESRADTCDAGLTVCRNGGTCSVAENPEGFVCACVPPHKGLRCDDGVTGTKTLLVEGGKKATCNSSLCLNGGSCYLSTEGEKVCICLQGYGGTHCENWEDTCSSGPCLNGASCYNTGNGLFKCSCLPGFYGVNCQRSLAACASDTCLNNGVCRPSKIPSGFVCICPEGYGGITCDVHDPCLSHPCQNGAQCRIHSEGKAFHCECSGGFTGNLCEKRDQMVASSSPCSSVPCLNGGTCKETVADHKGYTCICLAGVKGKTCDKDAKDECKSQPCVNGGLCKNYPGGFRCSCPYGLEGVTCEKKLFVDPCDVKPCRNGGLCKMMSMVKFECLCPSLFAGPNCSVHTTPCNQTKGPCVGGKTCVENPNSFASSYLCIDEKIQTLPKANVSWQFIHTSNMSREELLKSQMLEEPSVENVLPPPSDFAKSSDSIGNDSAIDDASVVEAEEFPKKKPWKISTTEIIIIVCVVALVLLGIFLCVCLLFKARKKSIMNQGKLYQPLATKAPIADDSWENLLSSYRQKRSQDEPTRASDGSHIGEQRNVTQNQNRELQTILEEDPNETEVSEVSENLNNSAGSSHWPTSEELFEGPEVFLVQPLPEQDYDLPRRDDNRDVACVNPISDTQRYALLDRMYQRIYRRPQLQMTPPKRSSAEFDEILGERKRLGAEQRAKRTDDGFSSVELLPPTHPP